MNITCLTVAKVVLFCFCTIGFSTGKATDNSVFTRTRALQFGVEKDINLSDYNGLNLTYRVYNGPKRSRDIGLSFTYSKSIGKESNNITGGCDRKKDLLDIVLTNHFNRYGKTVSDIKPLYGIGPYFGYSKSTEEFEYSKAGGYYLDKKTR
ncbi:MAG: hypothetical protein ABIA75_09155 [Candidatus Neomarinimicrobiota bacterium]